MSKYKNRRVFYDGRWFHSERERDRYIDLRIMEKAGIIRNLRLQVPFELVPKTKTPSGVVLRGVKYVADFVYLENGTHQVVEDVKGVKTQVYTIKKKLFVWLYGIEIRET